MNCDIGAGRKISTSMGVGQENSCISGVRVLIFHSRGVCSGVIIVYHFSGCEHLHGGCKSSV